MSENTEKNRVGAPAGNLNAMKFGNRTKRRTMVVALLGRKHASAAHDVGRLRSRLEAVVKARFGEVPLAMEARIQTVARIEASCRLAEQSIRETPDMAPTELRSHRESIVRWSMQRDRLLFEVVGQTDSRASEWDEIDRMGLEDVQGGQEGTQDGQECDPDDDTGETTPDDCEAANSRQGDAEGRGSIWDEVDRLIEGADDDGGDLATPGAD